MVIKIGPWTLTIGSTDQPETLKLLEQIMKTQAQVAADLRAITAQQNKIAAEIAAALAKLAEAIANMGNASPEVEAALAELTVASQANDDLNPDPAEEPPADPV